MDEVKKELLKFGLSAKASQIYVVLLQKGALTATELTKSTMLPKTTIYRFLDELKAMRLVVEIVEEQGRVFEASPVENLKYQIGEYEQKARTLSDALPLLVDSLANNIQQNIPKTKIKYYSGIEGLKQVTWNSSKAKGILRLFEIQDMSAFLNYDFCELARQEFVRNQIEVRELTNEEQMPGWTNVKEMVKNHWHLRYVDPKELKMEVEMLVYNDVYVMYNYQDGEIFCAEIYNERLANMQKQIFDFIWLKGRRFKILDEHGAAELQKSKH